MSRRRNRFRGRAGRAVPRCRRRGGEARIHPDGPHPGQPGDGRALGHERGMVAEGALHGVHHGIPRARHADDADPGGQRLVGRQERHPDAGRRAVPEPGRARRLDRLLRGIQRRERPERPARHGHRGRNRRRAARPGPGGHGARHVLSLDRDLAARPDAHTGHGDGHLLGAVRLGGDLRDPLPLGDERPDTGSRTGVGELQHPDRVQRPGSRADLLDRRRDARLGPGGRGRPSPVLPGRRAHLSHG